MSGKLSLLSLGNLYMYFLLYIYKNVSMSFLFLYTLKECHFCYMFYMQFLTI